MLFHSLLYSTPIEIDRGVEAYSTQLKVCTEGGHEVIYISNASRVKDIIRDFRDDQLNESILVSFYK